MATRKPQNIMLYSWQSSSPVGFIAIYSKQCPKLGHAVVCKVLICKEPSSSSLGVIPLSEPNEETLEATDSLDQWLDNHAIDLVPWREFPSINYDVKKLLELPNRYRGFIRFRQRTFLNFKKYIEVPRDHIWLMAGSPKEMMADKVRDDSLRNLLEEFNIECADEVHGLARDCYWRVLEVLVTMKNADSPEVEELAKIGLKLEMKELWRLGRHRVKGSEVGL